MTPSLFDPSLLKIDLSGGRLPTEHEEQRAFVSLWRKAGLPAIFAIPNGGARGIATAAKLKAEGVSRGVPDLYCRELGLWIEMKRRTGGRTSEDQKRWIDYLRGLGDIVLTPRGAHEAVDQVTEIIVSSASVLDPP